MGQTKTRLTALLLVLTMLLSGCGASTGDSSTDSPPPSESGTSSEISGAPSSVGLSGSTTVSQDDPSTEDARLLARTGLMGSEFVEISTEDANEVNRLVAGMWASYVAGPNGEDPLVKSRDWDRYTSSLGQEKLSNAESELFRRLDTLCKKYLSTSVMNGVEKNNGGSTYYIMEGARFKDLGLSGNQAWDVFFWFVYNHPQYYFLTGGGLWTGTEIFPCIYDFAADGEERAEITNKLFDKLDSWIQTVADQADSTYEKELYANNLICEAATYNHAALQAGHDKEMSVCQSLYSTVMLENTVCAGYAKTFCAMMNALDVDATSALSTNHAWNVVRCDDGKCYAVDVCWNDTDRTPAYINDYLNIGEAIMSATNSRKEAHTYEKPYDAWIPAIAKESYTPAEDDFQQTSDGLQNLRMQESSSTSVTLAWDEAAGLHMNHRHQFEVAVFADTSRSNLLYSKKTSKTSFTFEPLNPNTSYEFGIRLCCNEDGYTAEWTCLTVATADGDPKKVTTTPYNIKTVYQNENQAQSSWLGSDLRSLTTSEVCQYTDSTCTQMKAGYPQTSRSNYGYTWTGLEPGKTYYFGIRLARKDGVERIYSDWVNFSYTHGSDSSGEEVSSGGEALAAPTNIRPMSLYISKTSAMIAWDKVSGATGYEINIYEDAEHSGEPQIVQVSTGNTFSLSRLEVGTTYYLAIRAVQYDAGQTAYSEWADYSYRHIGRS